MSRSQIWKRSLDTALVLVLCLLLLRVTFDTEAFFTEFFTAFRAAGVKIAQIK